MTVRVRIAPSPTGNLHIGTARTAVFNWLYARNHGGQFILRIEDTDLERSRPEFTQNIVDGLTWLGLTWDEGPLFQSQRMELYNRAIRDLLDRGLAYRCYCTPDELDEMRTAQKAKGEAPRYDNRHRDLTPEQEEAFLAEGRQPVIRFKIDGDRKIAWNDLVRGPVTWYGRDLGGDMVIARAASKDSIGQPLYNLVVVVDDIDMAISQVIRGEDHIGNTPKQILLYEALGATVPEFGHTPLILNTSGAKLSKRDGVTSISDFRDMGYLADALVNYMTLLGWSPPDATQEKFRLPDAAEQFSFARVNKAGAKFDWDKLNWLNSQYIHEMPTPDLCDRLQPYWQAAGYPLEQGEAWLRQVTELVGQSLIRLSDATEMTRYLFEAEMPHDEEAIAQLQQDGVADIISAVQAALAEQEGDFTPDVAKAVVKQTTKATGLKKGMIMRSLRAALTCAMHGPDLIQSWLLLHQAGIANPRLDTALAIAQAH